MEEKQILEVIDGVYVDHINTVSTPDFLEENQEAEEIKIEKRGGK